VQAEAKSIEHNPTSPSKVIVKKRLPNWFKITPFLGLLLLFVLVALFPGLFTSHDPTLTDLTKRLQPPGYEMEGVNHWLGTDSLGRDVYSRIIYGASVSLYVAVSAVLLSGIVGGMFGIIAGYYRNTLGVIIMRLADIVLSIPFLLLAILTVAVLGPNLMNLVIVLSITRWPRYARVAYGKTLGTVNQDFVHAAQALGAKSGRIIRRHIVPEIIPPLVIVATLEVGLMIIYEAALSFIGLGVQPPDPSWGSMLTEGQAFITNGWWLATFPGICIFLVVVSVNMIGDHVRDVLDPKSKG
jgi:peptide/nickel transport system permease protein